MTSHRYHCDHCGSTVVSQQPLPSLRCMMFRLGRPCSGTLVPFGPGSRKAATP